MKITGIDPGLNGAVAFLDGTLKRVVRMPTLDGEIQVEDFMAVMRWAEPDVVVIEEQQSMPKQGVASTFKTGMNFGILLGVLRSERYPLVRMRAVDWKKANGLVGKDKEASRKLASELYPTHQDSFKLVKDDGMAEAALIARGYQIRYIREANAS